ncbi:30S ribosomal protein S15 [Candidatus Margulisiibacteriota bacterium]
MGTKDKKEIINDFQVHEKDNGSTEVQIALLTNRINHLVEHLKIHKKDNHTRRGLLILVGQRKRLIRYMQKKNVDAFKVVAGKLKLKIKNAA